MSRSGGSVSGNNVLRIVGGQWRSRQIRFEDGDGLRPTPDRVRETLFNWLQADIVGAVCLDAFAGSGALGFEALSRHAAHVFLVEKNPGQYKQLEESKLLLKADDATIIKGDIQECLLKNSPWIPEEGFDVVFLDPPFHQALLMSTVDGLLKSDVLKNNAWVYIETGQEWSALNMPGCLTLFRQTKAGQVNAFLTRYQQNDNLMVRK